MTPHVLSAIRGYFVCVLLLIPVSGAASELSFLRFEGANVSFVGSIAELDGSLVEVTVQRDGAAWRFVVPRDRVKIISSIDEAYAESALKAVRAALSDTHHDIALEELAHYVAVVGQGSVLDREVEDILEEILYSQLEAFASREVEAGSFEEGVIKEARIAFLMQCASLGYQFKPRHEGLMKALAELRASAIQDTHSSNDLRLLALVEPKSRNALLYGQRLLGLGRTGEALHVLRRYAMGNPNDGLALGLVLQALQKLSQQAEAVRMLDDPEYSWETCRPAVVSLLGNILESKPWPYGLNATPQEIWEKLLRLQPDSDIILLAGARLQFKPGDPMLHFEYAELAEERGRLAEALSSYTTSASLLGAPVEAASRRDALKLLHDIQTFEGQINHDVRFYSELVRKTRPTGIEYLLLDRWGEVIARFEIFETYIEARNGSYAQYLANLLRSKPRSTLTSRAPEDILSEHRRYRERLAQRSSEYSF